MSDFIMLVGLPGSGKSTYANKFNGYAVISSDAIRAEISNVNDQTINDVVFRTMFDRTVKALKNGEDVIYDATNINAKKRRNLLKELKSRVTGVSYYCHVIVCDLFECLKRNDERERKVPEDVIYRMCSQFNVPTHDEGWTDILFYRNSVKTDLDKIMFANKLIPHDNPHHTLSIFEHMMQASNYYFNNNSSFNNIVYKACKYHDIGKYFCKKFDENGVAHYRGHEHFGAYLMMCADGFFNIRQNVECALYIQHHMDFFTLTAPQILDRTNKIGFGDFYNNLQVVHECDLNAH